MIYTGVFEEAHGKELSHHGIKGMHWGVRNAETQARYAGTPRSVRRMAKKDAKQAAKLRYDYGARSRTAKSQHERLVSQRKKRLGEGYANEYENAYAKQNHEKNALKAEKSLAKDIKKASKSDSAAIAAEKVGATLGGALGGAAAAMAASSKYHNTGATVVAAAIGSTVGGTIGGAPGRAVRKRHVDARRKLNYSY